MKNSWYEFLAILENYLRCLILSQEFFSYSEHDFCKGLLWNSNFWNNSFQSISLLYHHDTDTVLFYILIFLHFPLLLYIFKFVCFFIKKIVLFNPFTSDLYLGFPFKKAHCFMGKNIVNVGDQRKDWISLEIYIQTVNKYIFLKSKINFVNFDWKINVAMATALNQSPPLKSYKKIAF